MAQATHEGEELAAVCEFGATEAKAISNAMVELMKIEEVEQ